MLYILEKFPISDDCHFLLPILPAVFLFFIISITPMLSTTWKEVMSGVDLSYCLLEQLPFFEEEKRKTTVLFLVMDFKSKDNVWLR
jgi:hypothetical protein